MENCLVTKLKGSVQNDNLQTLNLLRVDYAGGQTAQNLQFGIVSETPLDLTFKKAFILGGTAYTTYHYNGGSNVLEFVCLPATFGTDPVSDMITVEGDIYGITNIWLGGNLVYGEVKGGFQSLAYANIDQFTDCVDDVAPVTKTKPRYYSFLSRKGITNKVEFKGNEMSQVVYLLGLRPGNRQQAVLDENFKAMTACKYIEILLVGDIVNLPKNLTMLNSVTSGTYGTVESYVERVVIEGRTSGTLAIKYPTYTNITYNVGGVDKILSQCITDGLITVISNTVYLHWEDGVISWLTAAPSDMTDYTPIEQYQWYGMFPVE